MKGIVQRYQFSRIVSHLILTSRLSAGKNQKEKKIEKRTLGKVWCISRVSLKFEVRYLTSDNLVSRPKTCQSDKSLTDLHQYDKNLPIR